MNHGPLIAALIVGVASLTAPIAADAQERRVVVDPPPLIKAFAPQVLLRGDREFGGHGPDITIRINLHPSTDGSQLQADITMHAIETQSNWSETEQTWTNQTVMRMRPGERLVRIEAPTSATMRFLSPAGAVPGSAVGGPPRTGAIGEEDGGCICTHYPSGPGPISAVMYLGDTAGDDISTDSNPHGDTSIREIHFRRMSLIVE